jgi:hypothetical protein
MLEVGGWKGSLDELLRIGIRHSLLLRAHASGHRIDLGDVRVTPPPRHLNVITRGVSDLWHRATVGIYKSFKGS